MIGVEPGDEMEADLAYRERLYGDAIELRQLVAAWEVTREADAVTNEPRHRTVATILLKLEPLLPSLSVILDRFLGEDE